MRKILRETAQRKGLKRYYTGIPCDEGHDAERFVKGGNCCECRKIFFRNWINSKRAVDPNYGQAARRKNPESGRTPAET